MRTLEIVHTISDTAKVSSLNFFTEDTEKTDGLNPSRRKIHLRDLEKKWASLRFQLVGVGMKYTRSAWVTLNEILG